MTKLASIDIGSHTARLLISEKIGPPGLFRPLARRRAYIRLAEDFETQKKRAIKGSAVTRTLSAMEDFASLIRKFGVESTHAVSTGIIRAADNREEFIRLIYGRTGIEARVISGEEEARLTAMGVRHALHIQNWPFMLFDLGGGTTEFIQGDKASEKVSSVPLGAMILTQKHLTADPPKGEMIRSLAKEIDGCLEEAFPRKHDPGFYGLVVGTGGTVTTLAAMTYGIDKKEISPERMNGLTLEREQMEALFSLMKSRTLAERLRLPGLDRGRADVILAGSLAVIRILYFFKALQMVVSLSDLLEGILIAYLKGEGDE